jgi:hypothetical protein
LTAGGKEAAGMSRGFDSLRGDTRRVDPAARGRLAIDGIEIGVVGAFPSPVVDTAGFVKLT